MLVKKTALWVKPDAHEISFTFSVFFSFSHAVGFQVRARRTGLGRQPDRRRGESRPSHTPFFMPLLNMISCIVFNEVHELACIFGHRTITELIT